MNKMNKMDKRIEKVKKKFNKMCDQLNKRFDRSFDDVISAFQLESTCGSEKCFTIGNLNRSMGKVDPQTGELVDILMYFPDYGDMGFVYQYLDAYLITNREVLEETDIERLERLIELFR